MLDVLLKIFDVLQVEPNFLYQDSFSSELSGAVQLTPRQSALLSSFDQLNEEGGQTKAVEYVEDLVLTGRYKNVLRLTWAQKKRNKKIRSSISRNGLFV